MFPGVCLCRIFAQQQLISVVQINSTSAKEQINGIYTVMECLVKGDWMGEQRNRKQGQKDPNVGQKRPKSGKEMWNKI